MRWGREERGVRRMGERGGGETMRGKEARGERARPFATPSSHDSTLSACSHRCAALARQP